VEVGGKYSVGTVIGALSNLLGASLGDRAAPITLNGVAVLLTESGALVDGEAVQLSPREYALFCELVRQRRRVVSKTELRVAAWEDAADDHVVEVTVGRLRKRLGAAGPGIVSVPRRGYTLRP
jgi:uroporphyrinogen-III synthase